MARELHVAVVAHNVVRRDGQGRAALEWARALADRGHRVTVVSRSIEPGTPAVTHHPLLATPLPQLFDDVVMLATATAALRRLRPDVSVVVGPCALPRRPFVYLAQFSHAGWRATWTRGTRPRRYHRIHSRVSEILERLVVGRASAVTAPSAAVLEQLNAHGITAVIPNGIDLTELPLVSADERARARTDLGLQRDSAVLAFVGEYRTPRKGLDWLVPALGRLSGPTTLIVAGDGDPDRAREVANGHGVADRVHLLGFRDPRLAYAAADVAVVPSRYEPFSIVAAEAAACGLPVVCSSRVGAAEHLGAGAAVVHEVDDVAALAATLDGLLTDEALRLATGEAARRRAERLDWTDVLESAVTLVEEIGC